MDKKNMIDVGFAVTSVYNDGIKDILNANNDACGMVTDINKFIATYTVVPQDNF